MLSLSFGVQDVQRRLIDAIDAKVGRLPIRPTFEACRKLDLLQAVIQESIRLKSTVPINFRCNFVEVGAVSLASLLRIAVCAAIGIHVLALSPTSASRVVCHVLAHTVLPRPRL